MRGVFIARTYFLDDFSETLSNSEERTAVFLEKLQLIYPSIFANFSSHQIEQAYSKILSAKMLWTDKSDIYALTDLVSFNCNISSFHIPSNSSVIETESLNYADSSTVNKSNQTLLKDYILPRTDLTFINSGTSGDNDEPVLKVFGFLFHKISFTICVILVAWVSILNILLKTKTQ